MATTQEVQTDARNLKEALASMIAEFEKRHGERYSLKFHYDGTGADKGLNIGIHERETFSYTVKGGKTVPTHASNGAKKLAEAKK